MSGFSIPASSPASSVIGDALSFAAKREQRRAEDRAAYIRAIRRGDTYGFPPMLVDECRELMKPVCEGCGVTLPEHDECYTCSAILVPVERLKNGGIIV